GNRFLAAAGILVVVPGGVAQVERTGVILMQQLQPLLWIRFVNSGHLHELHGKQLPAGLVALSLGLCRSLVGLLLLLIRLFLARRGLGLAQAAPARLDAGCLLSPLLQTQAALEVAVLFEQCRRESDDHAEHGCRGRGADAE